MREKGRGMRHKLACRRQGKREEGKGKRQTHKTKLSTVFI
jgi:hypothetical protein